MNNKKRVLILYAGNYARSRMTEGLLSHDGGESFEVFGAGIESFVFLRATIICFPGRD
jgi:protein-tyrosine-phosphatase